MKRPAIDQLVYDYMFPKPKSTDPPNFQGLLQRQLVPEVRLETQAFYGHLKSQEAKYPGLDYSYQPHRARLSRYPWHRRLFRAFDNLGLTKSEIAGLTKWEGTRWAKERFEREQGIIIRDTTADGISDWVEPELRAPATNIAFEEQDSEKQQNTQVDSQTQGQIHERVRDQEEDHDDERKTEAPIDEDVDEESDLEIQSVGLALNERLRAVVAQREAGNSSIVIDEDWEQWYKEAVEADGIPPPSREHTSRANLSENRQTSDTQQSIMPSRILSASRLDYWHRTPELTHGVVRQNTDNSNLSFSAIDTYGRQISETLNSQRLSSSPLNRGTNLNFAQANRSNTVSPALRSYLNSTSDLNSRIRQWDTQRTSTRANSGLRPAQMSAIRSTQNRPGSSSLSFTD
ncbi:hypothetical protein OnM2_060051 [Erysiphe neolycopersici]|uniref:Uncharacterized protein n=1 Tax=Erysiphe neolycopersici TaxID=212602 RepID=A0A420HPH6_9PEZI|nr:hypothetical protein OnM2_060051 [Erysiphe neolycopersici]